MPLLFNRDSSNYLIRNADKYLIERDKAILKVVNNYIHMNYDLMKFDEAVIIMTSKIAGIALNELFAKFISCYNPSDIQINEEDYNYVDINLNHNTAISDLKCIVVPPVDDTDISAACIGLSPMKINFRSNRQGCDGSIYSDTIEITIQAYYYHYAFDPIEGKYSSFDHILDEFMQTYAIDIVNRIAQDFFKDLYNTLRDLVPEVPSNFPGTLVEWRKLNERYNKTKMRLPAN